MQYVTCDLYMLYSFVFKAVVLWLPLAEKDLLHPGLVPVPSGESPVKIQIEHLKVSL